MPLSNGGSVKFGGGAAGGSAWGSGLLGEQAPAAGLCRGDKARHPDANDGEQHQQERHTERIEIMDRERRRDLDMRRARKDKREQPEKREGAAAPHQGPRRRR